jgi:SAM-dependent methyltransferase
VDDSWCEFVCPACFSKKYYARFAVERRYVVQCSNCLSEMIWPLPSDAELAAYYSSRTSYNDRGKQAAEQYRRGAPGWATMAADHGQRLAERGVPRNCCWVEIGCSYGFLAIEMRKLGYNAWGVEYSQEAVDFINTQGGRGYCGGIDDAGFPLQHIDYCFSQSTLEHMRDPYRVVRRVYDLLVPGGLFTIRIPNWGSLAARLNQRQWKWFAPLDHIHYFRPETFVSVVRSMGYVIDDIEATGRNEEVGEILDLCEVDAAVRTPEVASVVQTILGKSFLADQFCVTARKPASGDLASAQPWKPSGQRPLVPWV